MAIISVTMYNPYKTTHHVGDEWLKHLKGSHWHNWLIRWGTG